MNQASFSYPSLLSSLLAVASFVFSVGSANATPPTVYTRSIQPIENTLGLYLVDFTTVSGRGIPGKEQVTFSLVNHTYRVYCPTAMGRDVTGGKWGQAFQAWSSKPSLESYYLVWVIYYTCPSQARRAENYIYGSGN